MKTKKTLFIISSIFALALLLQSCSDDFIDQDPTEQVTIEDLGQYNSDQGATSFITAIYSKYLDWNMRSFSYLGVSSITSDNADKGSDPGDTGTDKDVLDALDFSATTPSFKEQWNAHYQAINRTNQALKIMPELDSVAPSLKERLIGETKFLRAFTYFDLVRMFGGVPLINHVPEIGNEEDDKMTKTRVSKEEVYAFIEQDLKDAISALPTKDDYGSAAVGRASVGAAHALLAKVYLYQEKWEDVVDQCEMITGYSLVPDYADIFKTNNQNNQESIFELQGKGGDGEPGIQQYSQVQAPRGNGGWGWGFNTVSQSLINAYNEAGDEIRKEATVIFPGDTLYDGKVVPQTVDDLYYNYKAYSPKYLGEAFTEVNIIVLRYAEVLLMKAEALNELGQTGDAIPLLNQVRNRAELPDTQASGQDQVRKAIWNERRLELAMEHDRWFDIIRTGQAEEAMAADGKDFTVGKNEMFPIPDEFMRETDGEAAQNPGY